MNSQFILIVVGLVRGKLSLRKQETWEKNKTKQSNWRLSHVITYIIVIDDLKQVVENARFGNPKMVVLSNMFQDVIQRRCGHDDPIYLPFGNDPLVTSHLW